MTDATEDEALKNEAMEYALGLMEPDERRAFQADLLDDPDLADAVWDAEALFAPIALALPDRSPSPRLQKRLEERLFASAAGASDAPAPKGERARRRGASRTGLAAWRSAANIFFTTTVASLAAVAVLLARPELLLTPPEPVVVERVVERPVAAETELIAAFLAGEEEVLVVRKRADGSVVATGLSREAETTRQLWFVPSDGDPQSIGLLGEDERNILSVDAALSDALDAGATIAVSVEPPGGSPTGVPTGDVIGTGPLRPI